MTDLRERFENWWCGKRDLHMDPIGGREFSIAWDAVEEFAAPQAALRAAGRADSGEGGRQVTDITDEQIAAAVRPLYADDTAASMGLADDIRTVRAVLALQPSASAEPVQEPTITVETRLNRKFSPPPVTAREQEAGCAACVTCGQPWPEEVWPEASATGAEASIRQAIAMLEGSPDSNNREAGIAILQAMLATPTTSTTGKVDASRVRDEALSEAVGLYESEGVLAPVGNSAWGEAYQEGWISGAQAYREAIRSLIGTPKSAEGEGA